MKHRRFVELLSIHGEQPDYSSVDLVHSDLSAAQQQQLQSLLQVAAQVKGALTPVQPSPAFKEKLRSDLIELGRRSKTGDVLVEPPTRPKELLIGAAIGSAVALAGGIAYWMRVRSQVES
jgi:hypothetical protein